MAGFVHVLVFSNFEGALEDPETARGAVRWFEECSAEFPEVKWTHLYSPRYPLVVPLVDKVFAPYLRAVSAEAGAEVGVHLHLWKDMVHAMGVKELSWPSAEKDTLPCTPSNLGYGVLLTGYPPGDQAAVVDASIEAFVRSGFARPTTFCPGYSATNPAVQALLASRGFTASFSAQPIERNAPLDSNYGECWHQLVTDWAYRISPLTIPYRVNTYTIVPPPHETTSYLDIVEVPLNMWVDLYGLYLNGQRVTRRDMFDRHYEWAAATGYSTAVAIGVHEEKAAAESYADDPAGRLPRNSGPIAQDIREFLLHVRQRADQGDVKVVYSTASEVAVHFWENRSIGDI